MYFSRGVRHKRARVAREAAGILYYIVMNHPLVNGNKRLASAASVVLIERNGYRIRYSVIARLSLCIASGECDLWYAYRTIYESLVRVGV